MAWEQSEPYGLRRNNSISLAIARKLGQTIQAGALVRDQSPAALSTDSCWLVFLLLLALLFSTGLARSRELFLFAQRKIIYSIYFKSPQCGAHSLRTSVVSAVGQSSEIIEFVLLKPCSVRDK